VEIQTWELCSRSTPSGNETVLLSFNDLNGSTPNSGPILDSAGNLYGATSRGGFSDIGAAYKLDTAGNVTVLHDFTTDDGYRPNGNLVRDAAGNLYGTTRLGGPGGLGTVYKLDTAGNLTVLHSFSGVGQWDAYAGLTMDAAGALYGTTTFGGSSNLGTVFKIAFPHLDNFGASVVTSSFLRATAVTGAFLPTNSIDLSSQAIFFTVAGTNTCDWVSPAGSFRAVASGYIASAASGSKQISFTLSPLRNGNWTYLAVIAGYVLGPAPVIVNLTVGVQHGASTVIPRQVF
jgi:uncharacterized repeat protein (TIGR03803 family)